MSTPNNINAIIFPVSETLLISYTNNFKIVNPNNESAIIRICFHCFLIPKINNTNDKIPHKIG